MWSRIEDTVPHHQKFATIGVAASWLWLCGLVHSNRQLTDGYIPETQLTLLGVIKRPRTAASKLVEAGLWDKVPGGYQIHDFHDFNPHGVDVKRRRETDRVRKESLRSPRRIPEESARNPVDASRARAIPSHPIPVQEQAKERDRGVQPSPPSNGNGNGHASLSPVQIPKPPEKKTDPFVNETITERAGNFIRDYCEDYPKYCNGARYVENPSRDYYAAVLLCQTWDDLRLKRLRKIFLTTDHKFATEGSRTITQFKALASWCDGRLSAVEAGKA